MRLERFRVRILHVIWGAAILAGTVFVAPDIADATCPIITGCQFQAIFPCTLPNVCSPCTADACIYKCGANYFYSVGHCCTCT